MDNGRGGTNGEINHNKTTKETYGEETDTEVSMKLMKMMTKKWRKNDLTKTKQKESDNWRIFF